MAPARGGCCCPRTSAAAAPRRRPAARARARQMNACHVWYTWTARRRGGPAACGAGRLHERVRPTVCPWQPKAEGSVGKWQVYMRRHPWRSRWLFDLLAPRREQIKLTVATVQSNLGGQFAKLPPPNFGMRVSVAKIDKLKIECNII